MIEDHDHEYRIGIGTDIHPMAAGKKLMLGGVYVPCDAGLTGYSDGDVVLHAVVDALLGAAAMGDIGTHFPNTEARWENADSKEMLFIVKEMLQKKKWQVVNLDLVIHAERPRLEPVKGQIRRCIAGLLEIDFAAVNVKAKTNEGFGDLGQGHAIAATAITLLKKKKRRTW